MPTSSITKTLESEILDSGQRRNFDTGAVRDVAQGKGRCDLLPLDVVSDLLGDDVIYYINEYVRNGHTVHLISAIQTFVEKHIEWDIHTAMIEAAKQYEGGCMKYGDRNWELGQPLHCFIDSGVRHYLKYLRGDTDEPHDKAFLWNVLGAIWTHGHRPELIDLPFKE